VAFTWGQRWVAAARLPDGLPWPGTIPRDPDAPTPGHIYFVDVEGWYRITPYETVVRSPVDLSAATTEEMASALPTTLGAWQQVGPDEYIGDDPAVVFYLKHPTVALQRTYRDPSGQEVTLAIIGNTGEDSFLLFSHTPETCYPGRLWEVVESRQASALIDDQPIHVQYLLTQHAPSGDKLMTLYFYLWDNPQRSSHDGVLSLRVNLFIPPHHDEGVTLDRAWDFVRALFPATVPWDRF
jgi:hypothetical protein